jgi:hypothetical protein
MQEMLKRFSILVILTVALYSCDDNDNSGIPASGDYFPLQKGNQWEYIYEQEYKCNCNGGGFNINDTITVRIAEDPQLPNEYTVLYDDSYIYNKMARKEGHEYLEYPPYRNEYTFLVDNKPVNYSWRDESFDVDLTVKQTNGAMVVNGILYSDVIEIEEMIRHSMAPAGVYTESHRYFARNIGEIYSMKITYFGNDQFDKHKMKLLNHTKP